MFVVSFVANMLKRHPRCQRLVNRKFKEGNIKTIETDPYLEEESDPLKTRAMKSCLWEMEALLKSHYDERIRNYAKVFKTDLDRKGAFFKCEDFTSVDSLEVLE